MKLLKKILICGFSVGLLAMSNTVSASHHFEGAAFLQDSRLAQVDNYIFPSNEKNHTSIIMTINYDPKFGINGIFNPEAVYNIHLPYDLSLTKGKTFSVKFNNKQYDVYELDNPNPEPGVIGEKIGSGTIGKTNVFSNKIKFFSDAVKDPFFGNAIALEVFRKNNLEGLYNPKVWNETNYQNVFSDRKIGAIVIDIPNSMLGTDVSAFFTTDHLKDKKWTQVQYSARPLFSHVMLFDSNILRQAHDRSRPTESYNNDVVNLVSARILRGVELTKTTKNSSVAYADQTANLLIPDVIQYKVGSEPVYTSNNMNGRGLDNDIMSIMLTLLLGEETNQNITNQKSYTSEFPYLIPVNLKN